MKKETKIDIASVMGIGMIAGPGMAAGITLLKQGPPSPLFIAGFICMVLGFAVVAIAETERK